MGLKHSAFSQFKMYVQEVIPLDRDYLHILVGGGILAIYLVWKIWRNRRIRWREVVGFVLVVAVVAELFDIWDDVSEQAHPDIVESLKDIALTVFLPVAAALGQLLYQQAIKFRRNIRS